MALREYLKNVPMVSQGLIPRGLLGQNEGWLILESGQPLN